MCHRYHTLHWPGGSLQSHVEELHFVVINNALIIFGGAKKKSHICRRAILEELIYLGILRTEP